MHVETRQGLNRIPADDIVVWLFYSYIMDIMVTRLYDWAVVEVEVDLIRLVPDLHVLTVHSSWLRPL